MIFWLIILICLKRKPYVSETLTFTLKLAEKLHKILWEELFLAQFCPIRSKYMVKQKNKKEKKTK